MNLMGHDVTGIDYNSKNISMGRKILDFHKIFMDELYLEIHRLILCFIKNRLF